MRVPWPLFRRAYEQYPRWQALVLWVQAIVATRDRIPSWLIRDLRKRCPGFIEHEATSPEPKLAALHLWEWVHNHEFGYAKGEGWLDALTFYGVRHPCSESAWAYWEHCENEWSKKQPKAFPTFGEWWRAALRMKLCDKLSYLAVAKAVETYVDWEALVSWLRPLFASNLELPPHVIAELERRCPGIGRYRDFSTPQDRQEKSELWRHLMRWGKDHCLAGPRRAGWLGCVLERVGSNPRHVRMVAYGKHWAKEWSEHPAPNYPSFRQWRQTVDHRIKARPN